MSLKERLEDIIARDSVNDRERLKMIRKFRAMLAEMGMVRDEEGMWA